MMQEEKDSPGVKQAVNSAVTTTGAFSSVGSVMTILIASAVVPAGKITVSSGPNSYKMKKTNDDQ